MSDEARQFVWYDLMTPDAAAAETFYAAVVGWKGQAFDQGGSPYIVLSAGETPVAGLSNLTEEMRESGASPGWMGHVGVSDVDAAASRLAVAGGILHRPPQDVPGVGRFAVVADPQGAPFMLFQPSGEGQGSTVSNDLGHVGWCELGTSDWEGAFGFYAEQFGWTKAEAVDMGPMGTYQTFAAGGAPIGGMMNRMGEAADPAWLYYFTVDAIDAGASRVTANGGQVLQGPHPVPGGAWIVMGLDPQGVPFALTAAQR